MRKRSPTATNKAKVPKACICPKKAQFSFLLPFGLNGFEERKTKARNAVERYSRTQKKTIEHGRMR